MAYTFAVVDRNNGDTFREQDLDQLVENDFHLLDETDHKVLVNTAHGVLEEALGFTFAVTVGGIACTSGVGAQKAADVDVSGLTDGLQTLNIGGHVLRWVKTPDIQYVTVWTSVTRTVDGTTAIHKIHGVTIIGHREAKFW